MDIGCCLGQDIRKLIFDGAPISQVTGVELNQGFIDLGYELFRDKDMLNHRMVAANVMESVDSIESPLCPFVGKQSVVQLGMILHLFTWEEQLVVFEHAIQLLKPDETGTLIIGQASGNLDGIPIGEAWSHKAFKHNVESFEKLVREVEEKTGTQWKVAASLDTGLSIYDGKRTWDDPKGRRLLFEMERI